MGYKEAMQQCDYLIDQLQQEMVNQKAEERAQAIVQERCPYCHRYVGTAYAASSPLLSDSQTAKLVKETDGWHLCCEDYEGTKKETTYPINYCPMCGHPLNEEEAND